jgi:uncharacterized protein (TIGR01777 family)
VKFVVAGSSGFLGTALRRSLAADGHDVVRLVRRPATAADESEWDPYSGRLDQFVVAKADVVVNLAGAPLAGNPHSRRWAEAVRQSRVTTTMVLAEAVASAGGTTTLLAANGSSWYGDHGSEPVDETAESRGDAFLTEVTRAWQRATAPAEATGARVCVLRTAPVVDRGNLLLKAALPVFKLGLGARVGNGRQYFPVISLRDWLGAVTHLATTEAPSGAYNLCCPVTPTNAEFAEALAGAAGRRARLVVPAKLVEIGAGRLAPEALGSVRTVPAALERSGYHFRDRDVRDVAATALRG